MKEHPEHSIIHGHFFTIASIYFKIAKQMDRITIAHSHICMPKFKATGVKKVIKRINVIVLLNSLKKYSDYRFACSEMAGRWLFKEDDFQFVHNAIDVEAYAYSSQTRTEVRQKLHIGENSVVIGHIGRFHLQKNHSYLIDIFAEIQKRIDAKLLLIGDGPLRKDIEMKVKKLSLGDKVIFAGVRSDVADLLQAMDVFVFPSYYEGLAVVVVEAQTAGLPCLISDVISIECKMTDLVRPISLSDGTEIWAQATIEASRTKREDTTEKVRAAGYDVTENAERIQKFYLRLAAGETDISL